MKGTLLIVGLFLILNAVVFGQADMRKVDFKNFTYEPFCAGEDKQEVTVKDGEFSEEKQMDGYVDRFYFKVFDIAYGDLNGDGKDEAVILTVCNTGGTGNFSEGFVYSIKARKPSMIARIPGGDRAYGGLRSAAIVGGMLVVESNDVGEQGGACCPEFVISTKYKLTGAKIVESGKASRRELYPKERVAFAKGTSGKTFRVKIQAQDLKRFVIGARAGQTLTVSISTDRASLRLLDEADVTEGINNFLAVLPKSGDYIFEIQSNADIILEIVVNVKIR